ncbi:hypothetical protein MTYM_01415 [Methylococcales bacterium]|nr:hypothetical protein MTYM_01415 [Methylococcales bacterium]
MIFWIDAQLSPGLAPWIAETFSVEAKALRELGLRDAADTEIFDAARHEGIVIITKDSDFLELLDRHGPPPQVLWVTCGNTSNARLKTILVEAMPRAMELLVRGEYVVEISDAFS